MAECFGKVLQLSSSATGTFCLIGREIREVWGIWRFRDVSLGTVLEFWASSGLRLGLVGVVQNRSYRSYIHHWSSCPVAHQAIPNPVCYRQIRTRSASQLTKPRYSTSKPVTHQNLETTISPMHPIKSSCSQLDDLPELT